MSERAVDDAVLVVKNLTVRYGAVVALDNVSLVVPRGRTVCLLGANGAGKTSLMRAIMGLLPYRGTVTLDGVNLSGLPAHRRARAGLSMVPEGRMILGRLSVAENLLIGSRLGDARSDVSESRRFKAVLDRFPALRPRLGDSGALLSGGEQQMVAVGRGLLTEPKVLLMDEPSLGLAPQLIQEIFASIQRLRAAGVTILLVEQNAHMAFESSDFAYVLQTGRVVLSGPAAEVARTPGVEDAYLGVSA